MRFVTTLIILLHAFLFLHAQTGAHAEGHSSFHDVWSTLFATLNQERSSCDNINLEASTDLFAQNQADLKQIGSESARKSIEAMNDAVLKSLHSGVKQPWGKHLAVNQIAADVLREMNLDPVFSPDNIHHFDDGMQIGFCFGRALAVHYLLLKAGLPACNIYKIFAIGDLMVNYQFWRFHVAILIQGEDNVFIVVDPSYGECLPVDVWLKKVEQHDIKYPNSQTRFYITDPRKFLPSPGIYDAEIMAHPILREYFQLLGNYLSINNQS